MRVVLDTNIIVGAMLSGGGAAREVLRLSLEHQITPLVGVALFSECKTYCLVAVCFKSA